MTEIIDTSLRYMPFASSTMLAVLTVCSVKGHFRNRDKDR